MKPNTLIQLPDGRRGRVVYHNLDGYGICFGEDAHPANNLPRPEAMLRDGYKGQVTDLEMVGGEFEVIEDGSFEDTATQPDNDGATP